MTAPEPPPDVLAWWEETYTPEGVAIVRHAWDTTDDAGRAKMTYLARMDEMGG